jgi:hypothetical protein
MTSLDLEVQKPRDNKSIDKRFVRLQTEKTYENRVIEANDVMANKDRDRLRIRKKFFWVLVDILEGLDCPGENLLTDNDPDFLRVL